jgi:hypothetical protein
MVDEIHFAHKLHVAPPERLYSMVTDVPAKILRLGHGAGGLGHGATADLVVVQDRGQTPAETLIGLTPEMVIAKGRIHLVSRRLAERVPSSLIARWHSIRVEGRGEWLTPFNVPSFLEQARAALGPEIRLAGRRVTQ